MKIVVVIIAVLCGAILLMQVPTGSFTGFQVAGVGIIAAAIASMVP